jgi:hypothetical protein
VLRWGYGFHGMEEVGLQVGKLQRLCLLEVEEDLVRAQEELASVELSSSLKLHPNALISGGKKSRMNRVDELSFGDDV